MRVKIKGFKTNTCYSLVIRSPKTQVLYVYFSGKNYVLFMYYDENNSPIKLKVAKKTFKELLRVPHSVQLVEMDPSSFFEEFYEIETRRGYQDSHWSNLYSCENGCCTCCGCSCYEYE